MPGRERDYRFDNIRFLLIFLVVFAHLLECFDGEARGMLYQAIYVFHMPAFMFLTGYFAKFKPRGILNFALVYLVFQTLYSLEIWALAGANGMPPLDLVSYLTPSWLMWYLFVTAIFYCLVPLFEKVPTRYRPLVVIALFAFSVFSGLLPVNLFLALSRICAFPVFFVLGLYARPWMRERGSKLMDKHRGPIAVVGAVAALLCTVAILTMHVSNNALYASASFAACGGGLLARTLQWAGALGWIALLLAVVPNRRVALVSRAGASTMSIFLLHGFIVRALRGSALFAFGEAGNILFAFVLAVALVLAFGHPALSMLVRFKRPKQTPSASTGVSKGRS